MNRILSLVALVGVSSLALSVEARPQRVGQIPNGDQNNCTNCHISPGGGARNAFGVAVEGTLVAGAVDWAAIYNLDSDGDGYTNGEELGDPDGTWTPGAAAGPYLSHPGQADSTPCGNGSIEGSEECDGDDLGDATCEAAGFGMGPVSCSTTCTLVFSACENAPSNNEPGNNVPGNNVPGNNVPGNNVPGNNAPGNNAPGNNEPGNNEPGNNEPGNNEPGNNAPGPGPIGEGSSDDDEGCSTTGGTSAPLAVLLGFSIFLRTRRRD